MVSLASGKWQGNAQSFYEQRNRRARTARRLMFFNRPEVEGPDRGPRGGTEHHAGGIKFCGASGSQTPAAARLRR